MKLLPTVLLAGFVVVFSKAHRLPDPSWAVEVKPDTNNKFRYSAKKIAADLDCSRKVFSCNGCGQSLICRPKADNSIVSYTTIDCPSDRPYCDINTGSCSDKIRLDCGTQDTFVCTKQNHFFPDKDCTKFHYCDDKYNGKLFKCVGDGTTFNAERQKCEIGGECGIFNCKGNDLSKVTHSQYRRYYAMCKTVVNDDTPLVVAICPPQFVLNPKTQEGCEADCDTLGKGNIPDPNECSKYWTCSEETYPTGVSFMVAKHVTCNNGQFFDPELRICVTGVPDKNCKKSNLDH